MGQGVAMIARPLPNHRRLLLRIVRIEKLLRCYRPTVRPALGPPEKPEGADGLLAAVAASYPPTAALGIKQVMRAAGVDYGVAKAARLWARSVGRWPYPHPGPCRPAGESDPGPSGRRRKRKGGGAR
jgi:hypothetical protein